MGDRGDYGRLWETGETMGDRGDYGRQRRQGRLWETRETKETRGDFIHDSLHEELTEFSNKYLKHKVLLLAKWIIRIFTKLNAH